MNQQESNLSMRERVNDALARNWRLVVIILTAVVVIMAAILIFYTVQEDRAVDSAMLAEDIQDAYVDWMREIPEDRDDDDVTILIDEALEKYPRQFAAQRALFTRALMALENEAWTDAAADFNDVAESWSDSYLAPVSLFNAGAAMEQAGDVDGAKKAWTDLVELYADVAPDAPEALFNLGRLAEAEGDTETALEKYGEIASRFPQSRWTDLSKSRILVIEGRS